MSRGKLIEAIKEAFPKAEFGFETTNEDLSEWLYDYVDAEYLDKGEQRIIAKVGERFFRYYQHPAVGVQMETLEEVEPYDEIVTRYRRK